MKTYDADGDALVETVGVQMGGFLGYGSPLLRSTSTIDFTESDVNINTWLFGMQFEADTVDINFGSGDDLLILDVLPSTGDADFATAITVDLSDFDDSNEIVLSNIISSIIANGNGFVSSLDSDDSFGGNLKVDSGNRDIDLIEDMITIDNFDLSADKLSLDFVILHGESASDSDSEFTYVGTDFQMEMGTDVQDAADDGAASQNNDSSRAFYSAVKGVADYLVDTAMAYDSSDSDMSYDEVSKYYAATFDFEGDTYIYIDTNRNGWDEVDGGYVGLSTGDTLIKLTGSVDFTKSTDFDTDISLWQIIPV
jgi:hypothetical protein